MTLSGRPIARLAPGRFALRLRSHEREMLGALVDQLREGLDAAGDGDPDGGIGRLFPPAYPDDPVAEAGYASLVRADLEAGRRERLDDVRATLGAKELDERQVSSWLAVLNDLRLVLGTSLGVTEDEGPELRGAGDPDATRRVVFAWLGWLVGAFVDALAAGLPDNEDPR